MTTTTQERIDEDNLVDAAAEAAEALKAKTLATVRPEQQQWDENQIAILRQLGVEDATKGDLDLFFHYCRTTGLDPFRKQIYMIGRNTKITEWVENPQTGRREKAEKWVTKYTIQTGIDGYRRNGREAAKQLGDSLNFEGPFWCGEDGEWREVWPAKTPPTAAKFIVYRNGEPFTAVVHYEEFVQTNAIYEGSGQSRHKVGEEPNSMWAKMPRNQIAKCAEAMAWRRAYPDDFAGLILEDAAQPTVIDQDGNVEQQGEPEKRRPAGAGAAGVRAAREARQRKQQEKEAQVVDGDVEADQTVTTDSGEYDPNQISPPEHPERRKWSNKMFALFAKGGIAKDDRDDRLIVTRAIIDRPADAETISSSNELTDRELVGLCNTLEQLHNEGKLADEVRDWLNGATIAEDAGGAAE